VAVIVGPFGGQVVYSILLSLRQIGVRDFFEDVCCSTSFSDLPSAHGVVCVGIMSEMGTWCGVCWHYVWNGMWCHQPCYPCVAYLPVFDIYENCNIM